MPCAYCGQLLDRVVRGSEWSQANLLGELGKAGLCQQWDVSQQLVARVPFNVRDDKESVPVVTFILFFPQSRCGPCWLLTARGCRGGRSCAAHTGCSGKRGKPNRQGSHEGTDSQPRAWWWILCALRRKVQSISIFTWTCFGYIYIYIFIVLENLPFRKRETSSSWGMLSSRKSQYLDSSGRFFKYSRQAWLG